MVYYYEIVNKPLTTRMLPEEACPVCNKAGSVQVALSMSYISMLIPIMGILTSFYSH